MRAIVLDRPGTCRVVELPDPMPRPTEIVVKADCGARFDVAVDATGVPAARPFRIYNDELTIVGSMAVLRSFGPAVDLLSSGAVDPQPLLSEPLSLDQFGEAVNRVRSGQGIKWHIRPVMAAGAALTGRVPSR